MEFRQLPHTDLNVSGLCFGTMTFGKPADQAAATRMVDACLNAGINFFDTANVYQRGVSEEMLGHALQGRRNGTVIATKVFGRMGEGPEDSGLSKAAILKAIDLSLKRLQTDYVDLLNWMLHHTPIDCVILGASREEQLVKNLNATAQGPLDVATVAACEQMWERIRGPVPRYNM